jgi:hypothetical protein
MRPSGGSGIQAFQKFHRVPEKTYKSLTSAGLFGARVLHFGDGIWALNRLHCVDRDRCGGHPELSGASRTNEATEVNINKEERTP